MFTHNVHSVHTKFTNHLLLVFRDGESSRLWVDVDATVPPPLTLVIWDMSRDPYRTGRLSLSGETLGGGAGTAHAPPEGARTCATVGRP